MDLEKQILRRQWLNQILGWCIRGSVGGVTYSREELFPLISEDKDAAQNVPEHSEVVRLFESGATPKEIDIYIRSVL